MAVDCGQAMVGLESCRLRASRRRRLAGFTLIELMLSIAIGAVLLVIGVPSFNDLLRSIRLSTAMSQFTSDLYAAKGEAIKRNARVLVCAKNASSDTCNAVTNWATGWLVCIDADANGTCDASTSADPNPLIVRKAIHETLTLTGPAAGVAFTSTGPTAAAAAYSLSGTWSGAPTKSAAVALTGHIASY